MAKNLEEEARKALDLVTRHGVDGSPVNRDALKYGLEHNLFGKKDVDAAQMVFESTRKK